jgi:septum formation inhibitor MinC
MDTEITELDELIAEKVSGVETPANGTPFLVLKAAAEPDSPEAKAAEEEMTKAEADEIEDMLTKAMWAGYCYSDGCEACKEKFGPLYEELEKAKLKAKARAGLPKSTFAIPEKAPGPGSYPLPDKGHGEAALRLLHNASPDEQKRIKAAVHRKFPDIGEGDEKKCASTDVIKSPGVPDEATSTPKEKGHLATGQSGLAGPETAGLGPEELSPSVHPGGKSPYVIPAEAKVKTNPPPPPPDDKAAWTINVETGKSYKANWLSLDAGEEPGSPSWEHQDVALLDAVSMSLSAVQSLVAQLREREAAEDATKAEVPADAEKTLRSALDHLTGLLGGESTGNPNTAGKSASAQPSEEENIMTTVTKEELDAQIAETSVKTVKAALKAERKAQKAKAKAKAKAKMAPPFEPKAEKNANNGGDITEQTMRSGVKGENPANDVNAVGGSVNSEYINKEGKKDKKVLKAIQAQLTAVSETVTKMAQRPRSGGPVLDGQARGAFPASEARTSETVTKSAEDLDIERLTKSLDESKDPMARDQISRELTLKRLTQAHLQGRI